MGISAEEKLVGGLILVAAVAIGGPIVGLLIAWVIGRLRRGGILPPLKGRSDG